MTATTSNVEIDNVNFGLRRGCLACQPAYPNALRQDKKLALPKQSYPHIAANSGCCGGLCYLSFFSRFALTSRCFSGMRRSSPLPPNRRGFRLNGVLTHSTVLTTQSTWTQWTFHILNGDLKGDLASCPLSPQRGTMEVRGLGASIFGISAMSMTTTIAYSCLSFARYRSRWHREK